MAAPRKGLMMLLHLLMMTMTLAPEPAWASYAPCNLAHRLYSHVWIISGRDLEDVAYMNGRRKAGDPLIEDVWVWNWQPHVCECPPSWPEVVL